jgi:hypothetical protein
MIWVLDIQASDGGGVRVHLGSVDLPAGAELVVHVPSDSRQTAGPYRSRGPFGDGDFWTPTLFASRIRVEYHVPWVQSAAGAGPSPFSIDRLLVFDLDEVNDGLLLDGGGRVGCRNDVTCAAEWADVARAVARIVYVEDGFGHVCTGQLLNNEAEDWTPYVLTAHRCIHTEQAARTAEFYWLYQTQVCDAEPPAPAEVPRSAVGTLLAAGDVSDYALLMVEGTLPEGLYWAGWTAEHPVDAAAVATVHHAAGATKSISTGLVESSTSTQIRIAWADGGTQVGSEGAGAFRADTQHLVGQLSRSGQVDCAPADDAGAFSWTYPYIAGWLGGGGDDDLEDNNSCETARSIYADYGGVEYGGLIVKVLDEDWYSVFVPSGMRLLVELEFTHAFGDIDAILYGQCGGAPLVAAQTRTDNERLSFVNEGPNASLRLHVRLAADVRNEYVMRVSLTPANDDCEDAAPILEGTATGQFIGATGGAQASCGASSVEPDVWYRHTAACTGVLHIDTCGTHDTGGQDLGADTVLSVYSGCPGTLDREIACNDDWPSGSVPDACAQADSGEGRDAALAVPVTIGDTHFIRVAQGEGGTTGGPFALHAACRLVHDDCAGALDLVTGELLEGSTEGATGVDETTCTPNDWNDVWHRWTAPCDMIVNVSLCGSDYDTSLAVFDACGGTELACVDDSFDECGFGGQSQLSRLAVAEGVTYLIRVAGYDGAAGRYALRVAPANDRCDQAEPVTEGALAFCTSGAGTDGPDQAGLCPFDVDGQVDQDVWYCYTAPTTGYATIGLCESDFDNRLAVYGGCDCPTGASVVACSDDGCPRTDGALVVVPTVAGQAYLIRVGGAGGQSGSGTMLIQEGACVTDEHCDDGVFCNGAEQCVGGQCAPGRDPCVRSWCHDEACHLYGNGDLDGDGNVDMMDLAEFLACFEQFALPVCETANLTGDGWISLEDYAAFLDLLAGP